MNILGINAYHGDASAAVVVDGELVAAAEEERFTRVKHDTAFPLHAIAYCLEAANLRLPEVNHIALSRDPWAMLAGRVAFALGTRAGRRMAPERAGNIRSGPWQRVSMFLRANSRRTFISSSTTEPI
jgi:carbamoyltransferase